jgi:hypothetical protein
VVQGRTRIRSGGWHTFQDIQAAGLPVKDKDEGFEGVHIDWTVDWIPRRRSRWMEQVTKFQHLSSAQKKPPLGGGFF